MRLKEPNTPHVLRFSALALAMGIASGVSAAGPEYNYVGAGGGVLKDSWGHCVRSLGVPKANAACGDGVKEERIAETINDSDGDGVPDDRDRCPGTPRGVRVDEFGCPLDSDGDGVPDYKDKCPDTTPGAKVDAVGCEIIADVTIDVVNDDFDFDSAKLKPHMMHKLDKVVRDVKASPGDEQLTIVGHTDSKGTDAYNQKLSERRARATADYLVRKGIRHDHIDTKGMGESQPVADNATAAGRAKNRRVEILTR